MPIKFVFDRLVSRNVGYPNLAKHTAEPYTPDWRQFDRHWPWVVPLRLTMYLNHAGIEYQCVDIEKGNYLDGWYPVDFSWFDFDIDYLSLMSPRAVELARQGNMRILWYYHEGDNPQRMLVRLHRLAEHYQIPPKNMLLVSGNSAAALLPGACYFDDLECFFRYVNRDQTPDETKVRKSNRKYEFTALSRNNKSWRAAVCSDMHRSGILDNSLWSYRTDLKMQDTFNDNPISLAEIPGLSEDLTKFLAQGPYLCDDVDADKQIDFHTINENLYYQSYWHIITETHFDADQSGGIFLTEKTWKPIKYGQPFVLIGPKGSLAELRSRGYRVFDDVIDNSFDQIEDNTQRWISAKQAILSLQKIGVESQWEKCFEDVKWNMQLFASRRATAVNILIERLSCNHL